MDNFCAQEPGSVWYFPNKGGSLFTPRSIASGLGAHIAAGKVGFDFSLCRLRFHVDSDISTFPVWVLLLILISVSNRTNTVYHHLNKNIKPLDDRAVARRVTEKKDLKSLSEVKACRVPYAVYTPTTTFLRTNVEDGPVAVGRKVPITCSLLSVSVRGASIWHLIH